MKNKGFTLIELLIVIGIFAFLGTITLSVLFVTLRESKKTEVSATIRQNGDFALTQMLRNIRYAKSLDSPAACVPTASVSAITITSLTDDAQTTYSCPAGASQTISSNSASLIDTNAVTVVSCSFTCTQTSLTYAPVIKIQYTLRSKNANGFTESSVTIPFESTVVLRNY